jgi:hypothetical protein
VETRDRVTTLCVVSIAGRAPDASRGTSALLESVQRDLELPFAVLLERVVAHARGRSDAGIALARIDRGQNLLSAVSLGRRARCLTSGRGRAPRLQRVAPPGLRLVEQPWTPGSIACLSSHPLSGWSEERDAGEGELRELAEELVPRGVWGSDHRVIVLARPAPRLVVPGPSYGAQRQGGLALPIFARHRLACD